MRTWCRNPPNATDLVLLAQPLRPCADLTGRAPSDERLPRRRCRALEIHHQCGFLLDPPPLAKEAEEDGEPDGLLGVVIDDALERQAPVSDGEVQTKNVLPEFFDLRFGRVVVVFEEVLQEEVEVCVRTV